MGGKQLGFSDYELTRTKKQTKREKFLPEMEVVVPWQALIALIEPHYPKASMKAGRPTYPLATMLRVHLLQQWYSLSDPAGVRASSMVLHSPRSCPHLAHVPPGSLYRLVAQSFHNETCDPRVDSKSVPGVLAGAVSMG
jgi:hypothetical protein